jgi:hypothetical protein
MQNVGKESPSEMPFGKQSDREANGKIYVIKVSLKQNVVGN